MQCVRRGAHTRAGVCIHVTYVCILVRGVPVGRLGWPDCHHMRTLSRLVSAPINIRCTDAVMALDTSTVQAIFTALAGDLSPLLQASQQSAAIADPSQQSTATVGPSQPSQQSTATATCGSSDRYIGMQLYVLYCHLFASSV